MLKFRHWTAVCKQLREVLDYSFDTLRWTRRYGDSELVFFEDYNTKMHIQESLTLHKAIAKRFAFESDCIDRGIQTVLSYCFYSQLSLKKIATLQRSKESQKSARFQRDSLKYYTSIIYPKVTRIIDDEPSTSVY